MPALSVKRFLPNLTLAEFRVLLAAHYDRTFKPAGAVERRSAAGLTELKLLEKNPDGMEYRRTALGNEVLFAWKRAGWARLVAGDKR
jgi:hypothetical protein